MTDVIIASIAFFGTCVSSYAAFKAHVASVASRHTAAHVGTTNGVGTVAQMVELMVHEQRRQSAEIAEVRLRTAAGAAWQRQHLEVDHALPTASS